MNVLMMTGDAPRHHYLVSKVREAGMLAGHVIETREAFVPEPPSGLSTHLKRLFVRHFEGRAESEDRFFGAAKPTTDAPSIRVTREALNGSATKAFIAEGKFDAVVSYGVHMLSNELLDLMPPIRWNTHGGLSPWYRGVITLFWPSYMLEPQMTGMTLHELTSKIDAGPIVHQTVPVLTRGDGIHDLANRAVSAYGDELPQVLQMGRAGELLQAPKKQKTSGKLWLGSDWRPDHLRLIYDVFENRIVDRYLDNEFQQSTPDLVRQFD